jgi:hypothetical protein
MLARKTICLVVSIFLLVFASLANSQSTIKKTTSSKSTIPEKEWRVIDGFRSAKFGMDEKQVMRAIVKDFKITKKKIRRKVSSQKSALLIINLPKLMAAGGTADIVYIFGYKSKKLVQVNIDWGAGVTKNFDKQDVLNAANILRRHFVKKRYKKKGFVLNYTQKDGTIIVFRGRDKQGGLILLKFKNPKTKRTSSKDVSLILSYVAPDASKSKTK